MPALTSLSQYSLSDKQFAFDRCDWFAVVGATDDVRTPGYKIFSALRERFGDVVIPINPTGESVRGVPSLGQLSELPESTRTAVVIVTPVKNTLSALKQVRQLGVPSIWIQPGSQDASVVRYIREMDLTERCLLADSSPSLIEYLTTPPSRKKSSSDKGWQPSFHVVVPNDHDITPLHTDDVSFQPSPQVVVPHNSTSVQCNGIDSPTIIHDSPVSMTQLHIDDRSWQPSSQIVLPHNIQIPLQNNDRSWQPSSQFVVPTDSPTRPSLQPATPEGLTAQSDDRSWQPSSQFIIPKDIPTSAQLAIPKVFSAQSNDPNWQPSSQFVVPRNIPQTIASANSDPNWQPVAQIVTHPAAPQQKLPAVSTKRKSDDLLEKPSSPKITKLRQ